MASIANATDHNAFNADIGGNANLSDSITVGWSAPITAAIPEPASVMLISVVAGLGFFIRRRFLD